MNAVTKAQFLTALRGFAAMVFTIAASPVLHAQGVSFQTISIGFGFLYSVQALAQVPTGAWADIFGPKKSSVFGGTLQFISLLILSFGGLSLIQVITAFALYGLGSSFVAGALSSLLYEKAQTEEGADFNSSRFFSLLEKFAVGSYVAASASVGFLSEWFGQKSFLVAGLFFLAASLFVAFNLSEISKPRSHLSAGKEFFHRIAKGFSGIRESLQLKLLLPVRILHQVETILGVLWLPWIAALGGSDKWISVLATGSYVLRYIVNHYFSKRKRPHHYFPRLAVALTCMAFGCLICVFAENVWFALFGVWTMAAARGAFLPAVQAIQHEEFAQDIRTTGLSAMNFSTEVIFAVSYFVSAPVIDKLSVSTAWGISSGCFALAVIFCLPALKPTKI